MASLMGFAVAFVVCVTLLVLGRLLVGVASGQRGLRDAVRFKDPTLKLALGRAAGGAAGFYLGAALVIALTLLIEGRRSVDVTSMRVQVGGGGPAARAGIRDGDRIVSVDDVAITDWDQLKREIAARDGLATKVGIERAGETLAIEVIPETPPGATQAKILVGPVVAQETVGLGEALVSGVIEPAKIVGGTVKAFTRILAGHEQTEVSGPVAIAKEASKLGRFTVGARFGAALASYVWPGVVLGLVIAAFLGRRRTPALAAG